MAIGIIALFQYQFRGEKSETYEHTLAVDGLKEIAIQTDSLGVEVAFVPSSDGKNAIRMAGKAKPEVIDQMKSARVNNGRLELRLKEKWHFGLFNFSGWNEKQSITVALTEDALKSLEQFKLSSDSGSVRVDDAAAVNGSVQTDSGSIKLSSLQGEVWSLKSDSGSIKLDSYDGSSLSMTSDSGSIHAGTVRAKLKASSDSGSITVDHLNGVPEVNTDSGSIRIVKDDDTGANVSSDSGSVRITIPASYSGSYDLKSDSGSIHNPDTVGTSGELIKVRTDSGSIRINQ